MSSDETIKGRRHPRRPELFVTRDGRIFRELKQKSVNKYRAVKLAMRNEYVHMLVLETYVGPRPFWGAQARHLDGNGAHNTVKNLRWATAKINAQDRIRHGTNRRGEKSSRSKLTLAQAQEIYDRRSAGERGVDLAREFGVSEPVISRLFYGETWPEVKR